MRGSGGVLLSTAAVDWRFGSSAAAPPRDGLEHGASAAGSGSAKAKPSAGLIDVGLNDQIEVADDIGPFALTPSGDETVDEFLRSSRARNEQNTWPQIVSDRTRVDNGLRGSDLIWTPPRNGDSVGRFLANQVAFAVAIPKR
jgi:hypothetical protein